MRHHQRKFIFAAGITLGCFVIITACSRHPRGNGTAYVGINQSRFLARCEPSPNLSPATAAIFLQRFNGNLHRMPRKVLR